VTGGRAVVGSAVLLLAAIAACAAPAAPGPRAEAPAGPVVYPFPDSAVPEEIRVRDPKDMRGLPFCELLTRPQLVALGLMPETARPEPSGPGVGGCDWRPVGDPDNLAGFTVRVDSAEPALRGVYIERSEEYLFDPTEVAGHPAVAIRDTAGAGCVLEVGVADDQLLSAGANVVGRPIPDDCDRARRIAEAVLANLPPRTRS